MEEGLIPLPITGMCKVESRRRLLVSAVFTLTLSILGR